MNAASSSATRLAEALRLHQSRQFDAARALYSAILHAEPAHPQATHLLGLCEAQSGNPAVAIPLLQRAIALKDDDPAFYNSLGLALKALNRLDEAASAFERAIALAGDFPEFHNNLASLRLMQDRLEDAEAALSRALRLRPMHASAHNNLGMIRLAQNRADDAIACFQKATTLAPDFSSAWRNLGAMCRRRGDFARAAEAFGRALTLAPDQVQHYLELGDALLHLGQREAAIDVMKRALQRKTDCAEARYFLAALGEGDAPAAAPPQYIASLFDGYAQQFDRHLRTELGYRVPELIADALKRTHPANGKCATLDAGCGTGLAAPLLRPLASVLHGVDLSPEMVRRAEMTCLYDELVVADLVETMRARPNRYGLIVAADVLNYFGDLEPPLKAAAGALTAGGRLAFTVEAAEPTGEVTYRLSPARRYQHSMQYLRSVVSNSELEMALHESVVLRREMNRDVHGFLSIFSKPSAS